MGIGIILWVVAHRRVAFFSSGPGLAMRYPCDKEQIWGVNEMGMLLVGEQVDFEVGEMKEYFGCLALMILSLWFALTTMKLEGWDTLVVME